MFQVSFNLVVYFMIWCVCVQLWEHEQRQDHDVQHISNHRLHDMMVSTTQRWSSCSLTVRYQCRNLLQTNALDARAQSHRAWITCDLFNALKPHQLANLLTTLSSTCYSTTPNSHTTHRTTKVNIFSGREFCLPYLITMTPLTKTLLIPWLLY